jgi:hypothetical protein
MQELEITLQIAATQEQIEKNIRHAYTLGLPIVSELAKDNGKTVSICGGGTSLENTVDELTGEVWALNGTYQWLVERGIIPDAVFMFDAHPVMADYVSKPMRGITYYVASHSAPSVFEALYGYEVKVFHAFIGCEIAHIIEELNWHAPIFHGGSATSTRAPYIAYGLGYREIHIHGADSSLKAGLSHVDRNEEYDILDVTCYDEKFQTHAWMAAQAKELLGMKNTLKDAKIIVHGDGLLPHIAKANGLHYDQLKFLL